MHAVADRLRWIGGAGDDLVPAYYAAGIRAYTSSVSNLAPRLSLALHDRAAVGGRARLASTHGTCCAALRVSSAAPRV